MGPDDGLIGVVVHSGLVLGRSRDVVAALRRITAFPAGLVLDTVVLARGIHAQAAGRREHAADAHRRAAATAQREDEAAAQHDSEAAAQREGTAAAERQHTLRQARIERRYLPSFDEGDLPRLGVATPAAAMRWLDADGVTSSEAEALYRLEAAHLHLASTKAIIRGGHSRANAVEGLLLVAHLAGYVTALVLVLQPLQALAFVAVHQGLFGLYLGCSFAPNHKGMPTLTEADQLDFLRRQVLTSRNVAGSRLVDFVLGGLNYQIEHHLFPTMPRPNLRRAQPLVRAFCRQHGLPYTEASLFGSYAQAVRHLHAVGAPLRPAPTAD